LNGNSFSNFCSWQEMPIATILELLEVHNGRVESDRKAMKK